MMFGESPRPPKMATPIIEVGKIDSSYFDAFSDTFLSALFSRQCLK